MWYALFFLITLVLFIWIASTYRRRFLINSTNLSIFTPEELFPSSSPERTERMEKDGFTAMKKSKVIIAAMVRDVAKSVPLILRKVYSIGRFVQDWKLLIVENDSKDGTRELLLDAMRRDPEHIEILGCGINADFCKLSLPETINHEVNYRRIWKMAYLRNMYLDRIYSEYSDWDYVMMWDLDIVGSVYIDGIATSFAEFQSNPEIDCICANGFYANDITIYYDSYAHQELGDTYHISNHKKHNLEVYLNQSKYRRGDDLHRVKSCFNWFSIYRLSSLIKRNLFYREPSENIECEHVLFNEQLPHVYVNPSMIHFIVDND